MNSYGGTNSGITESITPEDRDVWDVLLASRPDDDEPVVMDAERFEVNN